MSSCRLAICTRFVFAAGDGCNCAYQTLQSIVAALKQSVSKVVMQLEAEEDI